MSDLHKSRERLYRQKKWLTLRKKHLARYPFCAACGNTEQLEVDHNETTRNNMNRFYDPTNLITYCKSCHSRKTSRERGHTRTRLTDDNGYPIDPSHNWCSKKDA